jgi:hypothetical protein
VAIKSLCAFEVQLVGDGVSTSITLPLATSPIQFAGAGGDQFQPTFSLAVMTPSGTNNVTASNGIGVTAALGIGTITFNFASAPNSNHFNVTGYFEF